MATEKNIDEVLGLLLTAVTNITNSSKKYISLMITNCLNTYTVYTSDSGQCVLCYNESAVITDMHKIA